MQANDYSVNSDECSAYDDGFTSGVSFAIGEFKEIVVDFANYYADMVMAAYNRDADSNLFDKFLSERGEQ